MSYRPHHLWHWFLSPSPALVTTRSRLDVCHIVHKLGENRSCLCKYDGMALTDGKLLLLQQMRWNSADRVKLVTGIRCHGVGSKMAHRHFLFNTLLIPSLLSPQLLPHLVSLYRRVWGEKIWFCFSYAKFENKMVPWHESLRVLQRCSLETTQNFK